MYFLNNYMKKNRNIVFYLLFLHELKFCSFSKKKSIYEFKLIFYLYF